MSKNPNPSKNLWFKPAQVSKGNVWYVIYWVENPDTGEHVRKRIKVNRVKPIAERNRYAKMLTDEINQKLYAGWNPFLEQMAPRGFDNLQEAMAYFLKSKKKELRTTSYTTYLSKNKILFDWLTLQNLENISCLSFNRTHAINFLRWMYDERNISNRTYNNYLKHFYQTFEWLISNEYLSINPFEKLKGKEKQAKDRVVIDVKKRKEIFQYFRENDYSMYIVSLLVFHTLLRPAEIVKLKLSHFSLHNQTINIESSMSKTKVKRISTIPNVMMEAIVNWDFNKAKDREYIFAENFLPGTKPLNPRRLSKRWSNMRLRLKIPVEMQLYSLRDSGIIQLLNDGVSPEEVMKQAGHSSLDMTTIYAKHANPTGSEQIKLKARQ